MLFNKKIFFAALLIYSITAIFSTGYYHPDEHYQIVEFAELKAGHNKPSDLPWEYNSRIRSALQPGLFYIFSVIANHIGISDHYTILIIIRLLTGLTAILVIGFFVMQTKNMFAASMQNTYLLLAYFLWFLPFLNVRFSSETFSGLMFLAALGLFYAQIKQKWFLIGLFLGFSFLFRFQSAFMSLGFLAWLIFIQKITKEQFFNLSLGAGLMFILGVVIDCWYYQAFTVTCYNYFFQNIINNVASNFGTAPWHFYFTALFQKAGFPIALLIFICLLTYVISCPKGILTWVFIPFLIIHLLIPHKEFRFLFPLANLLPMLIISVLNSFVNLYYRHNLIHFSVDIAIVLLATYNVIFLTMIMLCPADSGYNKMTEFISHNYKRKKVHLYGYNVDNPYCPLYTLHQNYFLNRDVKFDFFNPPLILENPKNEVVLILMHSRDYMQAYYRNDLVNKKIKLVQTSIPVWLFYFKVFLSNQFSNQNLYLFEVKTD